MKSIKPCIVFLLFMFLIPTVIATDPAEWMYSAETVTTDVNIRSGVDIIPRSTSYVLEYVTANVSFLPLDTWKQKVLQTNIEPEHTREAENILFRWEDPSSKELEYSISARVRTESRFREIRSKVDFPVLEEDVPAEVRIYLDATDNIDAGESNIRLLANSIASGEDDLFAVTYKLADWTKTNINYSLETLTADVSQKASWVLENRFGVCDELTNLFIAMLRSLGIPARFVSGIAFTNSPLFPEAWGPHGWAEVYFPGYGWVEWDVTYGEFGYVDPTHIKMKEGVDSDQSASSYVWRGRDVDIKAKPLDVNVELVDHSGEIDDLVDIEVDVLQKSVGFGSYNLVEAKLKNKNDFYVSTALTIAEIDEIKNLDSTHKTVLLKPNEERSVYWIIRVDDDLDPKYVYTFPMTVSTIKNMTASRSFVATRDEFVFGLDTMKEVARQHDIEEEKVYSRSIDISCSADAEQYYEEDSAVISCAVKNTGNIVMRNLNICLLQQCKATDLSISQEKAFDFNIEDLEEGITKYEINVENQDVSKTFFYDLDVLDKPDLSITNITYPEEVEYGKAYVISFMLNKESRSDPEDIVIKLDAAGYDELIELEKMQNDRRYVFNLNSKDLSTNQNIFNIIVEYHDMNKNKYAVSETFEVKLGKVGIGQRMLILFADLDKWLRKLFK